MTASAVMVKSNEKMQANKPTPTSLISMGQIILKVEPANTHTLKTMLTKGRQAPRTIQSPIR